VDSREAALKIVELVHGHFKRARTFVRAYDRNHAIALMRLEVDYQLRESFESAIAFSRAALEELGVEPAEAAALAEDVRKRDIARLVLQRSGGAMSGADLVIGANVEPEPLVKPPGKARALSAETRGILGEEAA
jgi:voltage-gated potassium channel Kch